MSHSYLVRGILDLTAQTNIQVKKKKERKKDLYSNFLGF